LLFGRERGQRLLLALAPPLGSQRRLRQEPRLEGLHVRSIL
jgi:hypothetical protein